jgi:putative phosphoesterase
VRIALISDTHLPRGARRLPDRCLAELERSDLILHAGDFVTIGVLDELRRLAPVEGVAGNMDEPALRAQLPERRVVEIERVRVGMVHDPGPGAGRAERLRARFAGCDAVVYGHTHVPHVDVCEGVWMLNPGSPTERRRAPARAMVVVSLTDRRIVPELVELGS